MNIHYYSNLKKYFNGEDESLIRKDSPDTLRDHLRHYEIMMGDLLKRKNTIKVLDLGCGDGKILYEFSKLYPEKFFVGIDLSDKNISIANQKYKSENINYFAGNILDFDLKLIETFDIVYSFSFIQYFEVKDMKLLIKQLSKIMKKGSTLVHMSIPDKDHIYRTGLTSDINIFIMIKVFLVVLQKYITKSKSYGNGFWWNKDELISLHKKYFSESTCYLSDSWYRFDFISKRL